MKQLHPVWLTAGLLACVLAVGLLEGEPAEPGLSDRGRQCAAPVRLLQPLAGGFKERQAGSSLFLSYEVAGSHRQVECVFKGEILMSITPI